MERLVLSPLDRQTLERWVRAKSTPQSVALRSRVVLLTADGITQREVAARLGVSRPTVALWVNRFAQLGPEGLAHDAKGRGRKRRITLAQIDAILRDRDALTPAGRCVATIRMLARAHGLSPASVHRILRQSLESQDARKQGN